MSDLVYKRNFRVHTYETDTGGHMSLATLFNYLQDTASIHASSLQFGKEHLEKDNRIWVLSRIYVVLDEYPLWNDEIIIKTWPRGIDKIFALRDFEIQQANGKKIGGAVSNWIMVNRETKRPVRPDNLLLLLNGDIPGESALERGPEKIPALEPDIIESPVFQVKYIDLDLNKHVNNMKYLQWTLDAYPVDHMTDHRVKSLEINYLSESFPGDNIQIKRNEAGKGIFHHSVIRVDDGVELCRIRATWNN